jgi:hypothetical protein
MPQHCPVEPAIAAGRNADALDQAVLGRVLALHPVQLTLDELVREMTNTPEDFGSRDAVDVAVRQLVRTGLLHRHGRFVLPTRAVMRAVELDAG